MSLENPSDAARGVRRIARVVVRGEFGAALNATLPGCEIEVIPDGTRITARVRDEAELFGIVERLRNLGAPLVSVTLDV